MQYLPHKELVERSSNNTSDFHTIDTSLKTVGISEEKQHLIYSVLAAILNLGNITFETHVFNDDICYITSDSQEILKNVAVLLHDNKTELNDALTSRTINVASSKIRYTIQIFFY